MVVTYGDLGRGSRVAAVFRVSFGLVKEIVAGGPSLEQARLRELVADRGGASRVIGVGEAPDHPQARVAYVPIAGGRECVGRRLA